MSSLNEIKELWKIANAVTFDVDSTVIQEEGIDELAKFCGKGNEVSNLTKQAMQGCMTFDQSLNVRLNIIKPTKTQIMKFLDEHPPKLTPGIRDLITALHARKKEVFLVSGGFRCLIRPVAEKLNIPIENIFANSLKFYFTEEYAGFNENELTSKSGGKAEVIKRLKEEKGFKTVVHVGDGATDLEACPPADAFIGFGGNIVRDVVKSRALWFVNDFNELIEALDEITNV
ncbi:phosphoserine phosphatase isoform X2 [Leptopilina boulardi]|nr:phosphoserine phosphatase isoform X2 [Leptopilina boulardi]XP_051173408.1 phosphoserine phosphatase isoform X2 [Leptopilina boulardi]XP_051173409.1 phosphoserine phosphatase isoform X2 [Leptopilina boulardi]XP_051173410.1 phosphoserine phosphatase isoform X2 [Leptopilina boulardi]XP_051173411.1 phosphoserine phosphatase isoform X2 [Leptopilina boulardi]